MKILLAFAVSDWVTVISVAAGIGLTVLGSLIAIIFKLGKIAQKIEHIDKQVLDIPKIKYSYGQLQVKVDALWRQNISKSNSPIILNAAGNKVLKSSGIASFVEQHYNKILTTLKLIKPSNAYTAQEELISLLEEYQFVPGHAEVLQQAAFNCGYDVNSILFVGAIYIRDKILLDLGFSLADIDKEQANIVTS